MFRTSPRLGFGLLALGLLTGLGLGIACGTDEFEERTRPEPPPPVVNLDAGADAGSDALGESCPESPPKIGDNCPPPRNSEQTCEYRPGTCSIDGQNYERREAYRCYMGTWHRWELSEPNPCEGL